MPVGIGDIASIIKDKNGDDIVISPSVVGEGDIGIVLQDQNGDNVVCCNGPIGVGDIASIVKDQNGDDVVIKPGGCEPCKLSLVYTSLSPIIYVYKTCEEFTFTDRFNYPELNLKIDFAPIRCASLDEVELPYGGEPSGLDWWPCGGVWVGLGSPDSYGDINMGRWLWILQRGPYMTIGDLPNTIINPAYSIYGEDYIPLMGSNIPGNPWRWCITDLLSYYTAVNNVYNFTFRYIQVHIRSNISLYFGPGSNTSLLHDIKLCKGVVCMDETGCRNNPPEWCYK